MPYRVSVYLILFLVFFNGGAIMLDVTGVADYLGVSVDLGDTSEIDTATNQTSLQTGTGTGSTLFGTYNRVASFLDTVFTPITAGPEMLKNAWGNPLWADLVDYLFTGIGMIIAIDIALFLRSG